MLKPFKKLTFSVSGSTAIEYTLIAALMSIVIIGGVTSLAGSMENMFGLISGDFQTAAKQGTR